MPVLQIFLLFGLCLAMVSATKVATDSFEKVIKLWGLDSFILSSFVLALGTSLPELTISVNSALKNNSNLALGNILGSNIANITIVIGLAVLVAGRLSIPKKIVNSDIYYAFLISAVPLIFLSDGRLDRKEGFALISLYFFWQAISIKESRSQRKIKIINKVKNKFSHHFTLKRELIKTGLGLIVLLASAEIIVKISAAIAHQFLIPEIIIGIFILGIGSSLPELFFSIAGIKNNKGRMVMGDILGSLVANSSLILGIACVISPINLFYPRQYLKATIYFLASFLLFYQFIKSKKQLERWEGAFLVAAYIILIIIEIP